VRRLLIALLLLVAAGCSEPPQKEIDRAQSAIDAARAAGADQYATEEYTAAVGTLQKARASVEQRDYRQALSYAMDARQRALDASRQAEEGRSAARRAAEGLIAESSVRLSRLEKSIDRAEAGHVPAKDLRPARTAATRAQKALQEAGRLFEAGNYKDIANVLSEVRRNLDASIAAADALQQHPSRPQRKRSTARQND
jgi:hypothetical protein